MSSSFRSVTLLACILVFHASLQAQVTSSWPKGGSHADFGTLDLVTASEPGIRNHCRVHAITEDSIVCGHGIGRSSIVYPRDNVAMLIVPPKKNLGTSFWIFAGLLAASLAGSFFVPVVASVSLRFIAGFNAFALPWVVDDDDTHFHDDLLYQSPDTPVTVKLR